MFLKDDIMLSIPFSSLLQAKCIYFFPFFLFDIVLDSRKNISYNRALLPFKPYHLIRFDLILLVNFLFTLPSLPARIHVVLPDTSSEEPFAAITTGCSVMLPCSTISTNGT